MALDAGFEKAKAAPSSGLHFRGVQEDAGNAHLNSFIETPMHQAVIECTYVLVLDS